VSRYTQESWRAHPGDAYVSGSVCFATLITIDLYVAAFVRAWVSPGATRVHCLNEAALMVHSPRTERELTWVRRTREPFLRWHCGPYSVPADEATDNKGAAGLRTSSWLLLLGSPQHSDSCARTPAELAILLRRFTHSLYADRLRSSSYGIQAEMHSNEGFTFSPAAS
jgi:hypothetical protein